MVAPGFKATILPRVKVHLPTTAYASSPRRLVKDSPTVAATRGDSRPGRPALQVEALALGAQGLLEAAQLPSPGASLRVFETERRGSAALPFLLMGCPGCRREEGGCGQAEANSPAVRVRVSPRQNAALSVTDALFLLPHFALCPHLRSCHLLLLASAPSLAWLHSTTFCKVLTPQKEGRRPPLLASPPLQSDQDIMCTFD